MKTFPTGTATPLARCISAEIRARLAAERKSQRALAGMVGATSHNYWSVRLRDAKAFTLDDLDLICEAFEVEPEEFVKAAVDNHFERVMWELAQAVASADQEDFGLAANESAGDPLQQPPGAEDEHTT